MIFQIQNNIKVLLIGIFVAVLSLFLGNANVFAACSYSCVDNPNGTFANCSSGEMQTCTNNMNSSCSCGGFITSCRWQYSCVCGSTSATGCGSSTQCCCNTGSRSFQCSFTCNGCCSPSCSGKSCGDNGCGGSCGSCDSSHHCSNYQCVANISITDITCPTYAGNSIKASDIINLRTWTNTARSQASQTQTTWTDATLTGQSIRATYMYELCTSITGLKSALGVTSSHTCVTSGLTGVPVKSSQIQEMCAILHDISVAY